MDYVTHTCKKCGCAFVAEDYTRVTHTPPSWRYCPECSKKLGIDYAKQRPRDNFSEARKRAIEKSKERLKEYQFKKKKIFKNCGQIFKSNTD